MSDENFINEINKLGVWYGKYVEQIRDLFSDKEKSINTIDTKFFSQYWQVYSWAAIIGFIEGKRVKNAELPNKSSIASFRIIYNNGEDIAKALVLMAISKISTNNPDEILIPREILTIISEYAEGGAKHILELRKTDGNETLFDHPDDYLMYIYNRI